MGNYKDSRNGNLADKGNGNYAYIDNIQEANRFLKSYLKVQCLPLRKM
jgi:Ca-activated chloride channel family protein